MDAVRAGRELRVGHDRPPARRFDGLGDRLVAAGDDHRPDLGSNGPAPDMHDHRRPGDIGQGLAGQPRRGEPGGNDDDRVFGCGSVTGFGQASSDKMPGSSGRGKRDISVELQGNSIVCRPDRAGGR